MPIEMQLVGCINSVHVSGPIGEEIINTNMYQCYHCMKVVIKDVRKGGPSPVCGCVDRPYETVIVPVVQETTGDKPIVGFTEEELKCFENTDNPRIRDMVCLLRAYRIQLKKYCDGFAKAARPDKPLPTCESCGNDRCPNYIPGVHVTTKGIVPVSDGFYLVKSKFSNRTTVAEREDCVWLLSGDETHYGDEAFLGDFNVIKKIEFN